MGRQVSIGSAESGGDQQILSFASAPEEFNINVVQESQDSSSFEKLKEQERAMNLQEGNSFNTTEKQLGNESLFFNQRMQK